MPMDLSLTGRQIDADTGFFELTGEDPGGGIGTGRFCFRRPQGFGKFRIIHKSTVLESPAPAVLEIGVRLGPDEEGC